MCWNSSGWYERVVQCSFGLNGGFAHVHDELPLRLMYSRSHVIVLAYSWLHLLAPKFRSNADHQQWASTYVHTIDESILCNLAMMGLQLSRPEGRGNHRYK